jgi:MFS family permease
MLFGFPVALYPAVAQRLGRPEALGLLHAAGPVGALAFTVTSGWTARITRHGRAVAISAGAYGVAVALFGLSGSLAACLVFLAAAGAADMASGIFRMTLWNQTIPDAMRGRLAGIERLSYSIGPTLGDVEAGALAALTSVRTSIVSGGILCVAGTAAIGALLPRFWRYAATAELSPRPVGA